MVKTLKKQCDKMNFFKKAVTLPVYQLFQRFLALKIVTLQYYKKLKKASPKRLRLALIICGINSTLGTKKKSIDLLLH
ncbi:hypothetical protein Sgly_0745 [Syntrophobotulus glycolicus DSM 8271]|uniref:Uncharacterized protein n=1 Tax=Syntrophobotulus glycolicus (strain DSM 8271 / FlGlyR) TaxID=645991 RepID=F0T0N7_SYNGF|nr:hypothetical protein Sgly_0745 [Syntrophobotulus glycolicus DSM 8271]